MTVWRSSSIAPGRFRTDRLDWARTDEFGQLFDDPALLQHYVRFSGSSGAITGVSPIPSTTTISAWFRPFGSGTSRVLLYRVPDILVVLDATGKIMLDDALSPGNGRVVAAVAQPLGVWVHVSVTYDFAGTSRLLLNGVSQGTGVVSGTWFGSFIHEVSPPAIPGYSQFIGDFTRLRIWSVARSPAEILADYDVDIEGSTPGLVGRWRMDGTLPTSELGDPGAALGSLGGAYQRIVSSERSTYGYQTQQMGREPTIWT